MELNSEVKVSRQLTSRLDDFWKPHGKHKYSLLAELPWRPPSRKNVRAPRDTRIKVTFQLFSDSDNVNLSDFSLSASHSVPSISAFLQSQMRISQIREEKLYGTKGR